jgi:hypothetical protein
MASLLIPILLAVVVLLTFCWASGKLLWWLRVTFPPKPRRRRRHR